MIEILGGYTKVTLNDDTQGNYQVAKKGFSTLKALQKERPDSFNAIANIMVSDQDIPKIVKADLKSFLDQNAIFGDHEYEDFLAISKLTIQRRGLLSRIFGNETSTTYELISPFKHPACRHRIDEVTDDHCTSVILDWIGSSNDTYPGNRLRL